MSPQDFSEFVLTPAGNLDFGELPVDVAHIIGRQPGPIRLRAEDFQHIYNRHKQEISQQGYSSVTDFVSYIAQNYNAIYRGNRGGSLFLVIQRFDEHAKNMIVQLSPGVNNNHDYYAVKTALPIRRSYLEGRIPLLQHDAPIARPLLREMPFRARPEAGDLYISKHEQGVNMTPPPRAGPSARSAIPKPFDPGQKASQSSYDHPIITVNKEPKEHVMTIYESNQYCIEEDHGGLRIAKLANGQEVADVFLQPGDDSAKLRQQLETLDTSNERQAQAFDHALSEYEGVMTMPDGRYYQRESVAEDLSPNVSGVASFKEMKSQTNIEIYLDYAGIDPLFLDADPVAVRVRSDFKRKADQEIQTGQVAFALEDQPDRFIDAVSLRHRALDIWDRSMASESPDVTGPMIGEIGGAAPEVAQELGTIASDQPLAQAVPAKQPETELAQTPGQESAGEIAADIGKIAEKAKVQELEPGSLDPSAQAKQEKEQDAVGYMPPKPKREPIGDLRPGALAPKEQANAYAPVKFYNDKNKHVMTDEGYRLNVRARASIDEKVLLAAIKEGQERFGEPVRIAGNPLFMARMAQVAVKNGIEINPDGPFKGIAEQIIEKSRGQEAGVNVIGGDAPEVMQFEKGKLNARVLGVAENGDVLIKQNGREKVLDAPFNKDHREQLRTMIGKPVEIQIAQDGVVQISAGPDMSVGHQQSRQSPGLAV